MGGLAHAPCQPGRKPWRGGDQLTEGARRHPSLQHLQRRLRPVRAEPGQRPDRLARLPVGQRQLPARRMPQLDHLFAEGHGPTAPGGQIDRPDGNLSRQFEGVGGRRSARDDDFAPLTWTTTPDTVAVPRPAPGLVISYASATLRGRPPFRPFTRDAATLATVRARPPSAPSWRAIQPFDPNTPCRSAGT